MIPPSDGRPEPVVRHRLLDLPAPGHLVVAQGLPLGGRSTWLRQLLERAGPITEVATGERATVLVAGWPGDAPADLDDLRKATERLDLTGALVGLDDSFLIGDVESAVPLALLAAVRGGAGVAITGVAGFGRLPRRWVLKGRVRVVDADHLAFDPDELDAALRRRGVTLEQAQLAALHARTAGWTGVVDALGALPGTDDDALGALASTAARTLADEVLDGLGPDEVDVVLRLAVCNPLPPGLAPHLAGPAGTAWVSALCRTTAWITSDDRGAIHLHPFVREGLLARSAEDPSVDLADRRRDIVEWLDAHGEVLAAVDVLIESADWEPALDRLRRLAMLPFVGRAVQDIRPALARIPPALWVEDPILQFTYGRTAILEGDPKAAYTFAHAFLLNRHEHTDEATAAAHLTVAHTAASITRPEEALVAAQRAITLLEMQPTPHPVRHDAANALGSILVQLGRLDEAAEVLMRIIAADDVFPAVHAASQGALAGVRAMQGEVASALRLGELAQVELHDDVLLDAYPAVVVDAALADAHALRGDDAAARRHASAGRETAARFGMTQVQAIATVPRVEVAVREGDLDGALRLLDELAGSPLYGLARERHLSWRARVLLRLGHAEEAARQIAEVPVGLSSLLAHAEVARALDDAIGADAVRSWGAPPWPSAQVTSALARAIVATPPEAPRAISEAAVVVADVGLVGPVRTLDRGLRRRIVAASPPGLADLLSTPSATDRSALSAREREVLRLLDQGLSRDEMATAMSVSINTTKSHVKNLYRKLGVTTRADALDVARREDLL